MTLEVSVSEVIVVGDVFETIRQFFAKIVQWLAADTRGQSSNRWGFGVLSVRANSHLSVNSETLAATKIFNLFSWLLVVPIGTKRKRKTD